MHECTHGLHCHRFRRVVVSHYIYLTLFFFLLSSLAGGFQTFTFYYPSLRESARRTSCSHGASCYQCHRSPRSATPRSPLSPRSSNSSPAVRGETTPLLLHSPRSVRTSPLLAELRLSDEAGPAQILPHLLLGNARHASDLELLRSRGVTAVLNVSTSCENHFEKELTYHKVPVEDSLNADIIPWLGDACSFIGKTPLCLVFLKVLISARYF